MTRVRLADRSITSDQPITHAYPYHEYFDSYTIFWFLYDSFDSYSVKNKNLPNIFSTSPNLVRFFRINQKFIRYRRVFRVVWLSGARQKLAEALSWAPWALGSAMLNVVWTIFEDFLHILKVGTCGQLLRTQVRTLNTVLLKFNVRDTMILASYKQNPNRVLAEFGWGLSCLLISEPSERGIEQNKILKFIIWPPGGTQSVKLPTGSHQHTPRR